MPLHAKAYRRLCRKVVTAKTIKEQDFWLDEILDCHYRATEWDADQWGFNPDLWMEPERRELNLNDPVGG